MKKTALSLAIVSTIILTGCGPVAPEKTVAPTAKTTINLKTYTVDEFVEKGFKDAKEVQIVIKSIICDKYSCNIKGDGKWSLKINQEDSISFFPYSGKTADMIVRGIPDNCPVTAERCNAIKNAWISKKL